MAEYKSESISPTVEKVLDKFIAALHADEDIDTAAADRLDVLLRGHKVPKVDDIDAALLPPPNGNKP